jgi:hypothetical protein
VLIQKHDSWHDWLVGQIEGGDDESVMGPEEAGRSSVKSDDARRPSEAVRLDPSLMINGPNVDEFAVNQPNAVHQLSIDFDASYIVRIRVGDGRVVEFCFEKL